jgi:hypothetical protein
MTRISLKIQQPAGEVERHIDRANGVPAVEAAMCCDSGTKEIGHDSLLLQSRVQDIDIWPGFSFEAPAAALNVDIAAECLHHTLLNRLAERCERFRRVVPGKFSVMSDASPSGWPLQI